MNTPRVQHLDAARVASKAARQDTAPLGLPDDRWAGLRDGALRADGLLALELASTLTEPAPGRQRDTQAARQARDQMWCSEQCAACDAPPVLGEPEIHHLAEHLDRMLVHNRRAGGWIETAWQVQRSLSSDPVTQSGLLHALARLQTGDSELDRSTVLLALSRLLAGPPATRVQLLCMGVPVYDELTATVDLPGGWQGGGFPGGLFAEIAPHPACWPDASYSSFDLFEAWPLWWAWKVEEGCVPELPDPLARWHPDLFQPPSDAERLITLLHQITFPEPVKVAGRFLAFTGHGLVCLDGDLRATYDAWDDDPWELVDPLRDTPDPADVSALGWLGDHYTDDAFSDPDPQARFLQALAEHLSAVEVSSPDVRRIARASDHLLRADLSNRGDTGGQIALELAIALEVLLNDGTKRSEIASSLSQRAALLTGGNDTEREETAGTVADLYTLSSAYRHGAELPVAREAQSIVAGRRSVDIRAARRVVRQIASSILLLTAGGEHVWALIADAAVTRAAQERIDRYVSQARGLTEGGLETLDRTAERPTPDLTGFILWDDDRDPAPVVELRADDETPAD